MEKIATKITKGGKKLLEESAKELTRRHYVNLSCGGQMKISCLSERNRVDHNGPQAA